MADSSQKKSANVTLADVARACGLAKSTVSQALRDDGTIARKTRENVRRVAREIGYRPHPTFAAIGTRRRRRLTHEVTIAVLREAGHEDHFDDRYLEPSREIAERMGYDLETFTLKPGVSNKPLGRTLFHRGFRLVLLSGGGLGDYSDFPWWHFGAVAVGDQARKPPIDFVRENSVDGINLVWDKAREAGYTRIGYYNTINPDGTYSMLDERRIATFEWLQRRDFARKDQVPVLKSRDPFDAEIFQQWLAHEQPEVVISKTALPWSTREKFFPGKPLPVIAMHNRAEHPGLAGIPNMNMDCYETALQLLDQKFRLGHFGYSGLLRTITLAPRWQDGESFWPKP